jgi:hypothetical protein
VPTPVRQSLVRPDADRYMRWQSRAIEVKTEGRHDVVIANMQGREVLRLSGYGPMSHSLDALPSKGLYSVRLEAEGLSLTQTWVHGGVQ